MDAAVKAGGRDWCGLVGHGGGWGRATGARSTTTVTLRCAGRDRRTVSGRELPRTRVASRDRIEPSRVLRESRRSPGPSGRWWFRRRPPGGWAGRSFRPRGTRRARGRSRR
jgi:hypothetical protein